MAFFAPIVADARASSGILFSEVALPVRVRCIDQRMRTRHGGIDAFSNNLRVAVVAEGCFDHVQVSRAINLCDMHAKYATW